MDQKDQLTRISDKLQLLIKQFDSLKRENIRLSRELKDSLRKNDVLESKITALEQTVFVLKTVSGNMGDEDKKELEKKLNHYLKEIDRCIGILSD